MTAPGQFPIDVYFAAWGDGYVIYAPGQAPIYLISDKQGGFIIQRPGETAAFVTRRKDDSGWNILRANAPATMFLKNPEAVVGPGDDVVHHAITKELDYEVELTVVIGTGGRDIARADALKHVFGYTIINDVTARDLQKKHQQWFKGKSLDTFCPMGPVLVTADEIPNPQVLNVTMRVGGQVRQSSNTSKMIFPVDQCIEVLSLAMTLLPGDIIATGTPDGVGAATGNFLKAGDRMEAEVEKIGVLANKVVRP